MCIITKNNVENGGYEDLRRQRAAYLLFHDKIEQEPNDLDSGLSNWNLSENSKPIYKFMLHQQLTQMKIYFANHIVNRIESSKNILLLKLFPVCRDNRSTMKHRASTGEHIPSL